MTLDGRSLPPLHQWVRYRLHDATWRRVQPSPRGAVFHLGPARVGRRAGFAVFVTDDRDQLAYALGPVGRRAPNEPVRAVDLFTDAEEAWSFCEAEYRGVRANPPGEGDPKPARKPRARKAPGAAGPRISLDPEQAEALERPLDAVGEGASTAGPSAKARRGGPRPSLDPDRAEALGSALRAFAEGPGREALARVLPGLSPRPSRPRTLAETFLLAEAFVRWAGPSAELLVVHRGASPAARQVVAAWGDWCFDALGARRPEHLLEDEVREGGGWLGPLERSVWDADDGLGATDDPRGLVAQALARALGDPAAWGLRRGGAPAGWDRLIVEATRELADRVRKSMAALPGVVDARALGPTVMGLVPTQATRAALAALKKVPGAKEVTSEPVTVYDPHGPQPGRLVLAEQRGRTGWGAYRGDSGE